MGWKLNSQDRNRRYRPAALVMLAAGIAILPRLALAQAVAGTAGADDAQADTRVAQPALGVVAAVVVDRIHALQTQLHREARKRVPFPVVALVGYTNAGKSTLLNALTGSTVEAADKLFMTLDPTSRRLRFPREGEVVITDTVGFIADLPKDLVAAFRATLEELSDADLLLHVVDVADPQMEQKLLAVEKILQELHLDDRQRLVVLNKADLVEPDVARAQAERHHGVALSAAKRQGLADLIHVAEERLGREKPLLKDYGQAAAEEAAGA